ncbi:myb/SANT-like DNA-binding domain-containing protein 3 isoform X4 [Lytechinus variegatus]|uniref:myb/SANT-like DNA-binding domain-containing protein 3 isoform X2 n=1 Tax=Lytechinus variegatus TaxID=7654 RepID=UPI001BB2A55B|nr:myb/SANT-like DNA-binding domain-containing protein 3 isoform X2 [Lytechinus variegatus]XP_041482944.1 myb/SANT-like DNA-binding domain-containing protein 3 isoform X4 [Lytechinus variegatus]
MESAKNRSANWHHSERSYLLELVQDRAHIFANRANDALNNKRKNLAWDEVCSAIIARYGNKWTTGQIKTKWKQLRSQAKKEYGEWKRRSRMTGGGPPPDPPSSVTLLIKEILPSDFIQLSNPYDDDAGLNNEAVTALEFLSHGGLTTGDDCLQQDEQNSLHPATSHEPVLASTSQANMQNSSLPSTTQNGDIETTRQDTTRKLQPRGEKRRSTIPHQPKTRPKHPHIHSSEERLVELAEEEHQIRLEYMRIEHEYRMEILKVQKKTEEVKLKAALAAYSED